MHMVTNSEFVTSLLFLFLQRASIASQVESLSLSFWTETSGDHVAVATLCYRKKILTAAMVGITKDTSMNMTRANALSVTSGGDPVSCSVLNGLVQISTGTRQSIVSKYYIHHCILEDNMNGQDQRSICTELYTSQIAHTLYCDKIQANQWVTLQEVHKVEFSSGEKNYGIKNFRQTKCIIWQNW